MIKQRYITLMRVIGILLILEAGFMLLSLGVAIAYGGNDIVPLSLSTGITMMVGLTLRFFKRRQRITQIDPKLGFMIVAMIWLVMSVFGALPYFLGGYTKSYFDAFFESMSGFSTTSATIITNVEALPNGILFWRSLTNWIGGVGIVVIVISFIPFFGGGGMSLFAAEVTGPNKGKLSPHIKTTGKIIVAIYVSLTLIAALCLWIGGMTPFDAVCHAFATLSSGGFSTKNTSISLYSPLIHYILIVFMIPSGINFPLMYYAIKGRFRKIVINEEFKVYIYAILVATGVIFLLTYDTSLGLEASFRHSLFQTVSIITSAGFISYDYALWGTSASLILLLLMFSGAMSGSTTGGLKIIRIIILFKNAKQIIKRSFHKRAVLPIKFEKQIVEPRVVHNVLIVFLLCIITFVVAVLALVGMGLDLEEAAGASVSCLSNMGTGFGDIGAFGDYSTIPNSAKAIFISLMYLGRLELVTVLVLFMPSFWKSSF